MPEVPGESTIFRAVEKIVPRVVEGAKELASDLKEGAETVVNAVERQTDKVVAGLKDARTGKIPGNDPQLKALAKGVAELPHYAHFEPATVKIDSQGDYMKAVMTGHYPGSTEVHALDVTLTGDPFPRGEPFNAKGIQFSITEDGKSRVLTPEEELNIDAVLTRAQQALSGDDRDAVTSIKTLLAIRHPETAHLPSPLEFQWTDKDGITNVVSYQGDPMKPEAGKFRVDMSDGQGHSDHRDLDGNSAAWALSMGLDASPPPPQGELRDRVAVMKVLLMVRMQLEPPIRIFNP